MNALRTPLPEAPGDLAIAAAVGIDELSVALSIAGVGAIVGQGFAAYRYGRDPRANTTRIIFSWTLSGFVLGWMIVLGVALL